ncbi:hypothetical protein Tco_1327525 [Tanacetum coccineum]
MEKLESENVSLEFQVQSLMKEQDNVKTEYQKLFDSIKRTQNQTQGEINELIENVNQKTYAYADVRAQNQDLLIRISELKYYVLTDHLIHRIHQLDTTYQTFYPEQHIDFYSLNDVSVLPNNTAYSRKSIRRTGIQQTYMAYSH